MLRVCIPKLPRKTFGLNVESKTENVLRRVLVGSGETGYNGGENVVRLICKHDFVFTVKRGSLPAARLSRIYGCKIKRGFLGKIWLHIDISFLV